MLSLSFFSLAFLRGWSHGSRRSLDKKKQLFLTTAEAWKLQQRIKKSEGIVSWGWLSRMQGFVLHTCWVAQCVSAPCAVCYAWKGFENMPRWYHLPSLSAKQLVTKDDFKARGKEYSVLLSPPKNVCFTLSCFLCKRTVSTEREREERRLILT